MSKNELKSNVDEQPISLAEHLSSVLDDEAGSFEQRRVLDELISGEKPSDSSQKLSQKLSHFALIGESMRSTHPTAVAGPNFLDGIHKQIDLDDDYQNIQVPSSSLASEKDIVIPQQATQSSWLRPIGGFALVASFAAVAVMGLQNYQLNNQLEAQSKTIIAMQASAKEAQTVAAAPAKESVMIASVENPNSKRGNTDKLLEKEYRQADVHARSFLKRYIDSHVQYASRSTFVPSVRVIAYADY